MVKRGRGQPKDPLYHSSLDKRAFKLALLGLTDKGLAFQLDISVDTIYLWRKKHPSFARWLDKGKTEADANVARAMYKRALGYDHKEVHVSIDKKTGKLIQAEATKHYPADVGAMCFWLKNRTKPKTTRDPESLTWRDTQEVAHSGRVQLQPVRSPIDLSDLNNAELAAVKKLGLNNLQKQLAKGDPDTNQNENG